MSQLNLDTNDPRSGRLITTDDLYKMGLDLQLMLNLTNNNTLKCPDAWAQGNTDAAFACNNFVGVQRSHSSNEYRYDWVNFSADRGLYIYTPGEAYVMQQITNGDPAAMGLKTIPMDPLQPVNVAVGDLISSRDAYLRTQIDSAIVLDFQRDIRSVLVYRTIASSVIPARTKTVEMRSR